MIKTILIIANFVQLLTEAFKKVCPRVSGWIVSLVLSLLICVSGKIGMLNEIGIRIDPILDYILTGCAITTGSNALHEFLKVINVVRSNENEN